MNQKLPNIFQFATKELSQDAFLCWLLSLAHKKYATEETQVLHEMAVNLINNLVNNPDFKFTEVIVKKQKEKVDIWLEIDDKYLIIIEDKTNSNAGIDQLPRYKKIATDYCREKDFELLKCIYLKTGLESASKFTSSVKNQGWTMISLEDLYDIFNLYENKISHPFVLDFYRIIKEKIERRRNYTSFIIGNEACRDVIPAFYNHLEQDGIFKSWKVEDIRGTRRLIADNCYSKEDEYAVYLQMEKLKLKVKVDLGQLGSETGKKYKSFKKAFDQFDSRAVYDKTRSLLKDNPFFSDKVSKPAKFSKHNYLTFADIDDSAWLVITKDGKLDYKQTSENLSKIKNQLADFVTNSQSSLKNIVEDVFSKN